MTILRHLRTQRSTKSDIGVVVGRYISASPYGRVTYYTPCKTLDLRQGGSTTKLYISDVVIRHAAM